MNPTMPCRQALRASLLTGAMLVSTLSSAASRVADEIYLMVPDIDGGSERADREGAIDLLG